MMWYSHTVHVLIGRINTDQLNTITKILYILKFQPGQRKYLNFVQIIICKYALYRRFGFKNKELIVI